MPTNEEILSEYFPTPLNRRRMKFIGLPGEKGPPGDKGPSGDAGTPVKGLSGFCSGLPSANERVAGGVSPYSFTISQANSSAKALVAATAPSVFTIKTGSLASPTVLGTYTFGAGDTEATTNIVEGGVTSGNFVWVEAPSSPDASLSDISFLIKE